MSLVGIIAAYLVTRIEFRGRAVLEFLITVPFAVPGTFMGVGYVLAFNQAPLLLTGTWAIVFVLVLVRELPLGLRSGVSVLEQQDRAIEDASVNLGASRLTTFCRVILPLARPVLLVSSLYAFVATVQTVGAIIFVITPGTKLLSVDVFEAIFKGDIGAAAALSVTMLLLSAAGGGAIYLTIQRETAAKWVRKMLGHPQSV
jgi:iron(III) transport system permease protein